MSVTKKEFDLGVESDIEHVGKGTSYGAYFNIVNALAGVGLLGLANAVSQSGWFGVILIFVAGAFSIYTGTLLVQCMNDKRHGFIETYPDVGMATFGIVGRTVVQFCQYSIICGGVTLYMVYAGTQVHNILVEYNLYANLSLLIGAAGMIIWVPLVSLKTVREVSWISMFGGLASLVTVIIAVTLCVNDIPNQPIRPAEPFFKYEGVGPALANISFSYGGTMIYPHVYRSMKNPKRWYLVVTLATLTAATMYLLISTVGYGVYGSEALNPIFKNLPVGVPSKTASLLLACHVLCAGTVFLCSLALEAERFLNVSVEKLGKAKEFLFRVIIRTTILGCLVAIGCAVPYFDNLMELIGAVSECMLVFLVPTVCHVKMFGWGHRPWYEKIWIVAIIITATICLIFGTKGAIEGFIKKFNEKQ